MFELVSRVYETSEYSYYLTLLLDIPILYNVL